MPDSIDTTKHVRLFKMESNDRNMFIPERLALKVYFGQPIHKFSPP